jgi:hypothetical protein
MSLRSPLGRSVAAVIVGLSLFLLTGWASGQPHLVLDWRAFEQTDALVFLGAYAQLVLASAVFFQIRTADRALERQYDVDAQAQRTRQAEILLELLGAAANARSLYVQSIPALKEVARAHGDFAVIERAETELIPAEQFRQRAHAARVHVDAICPDDDALMKAAREITTALDEQRRNARAVNVWSRNPGAASTPAPDPQEVARFPMDAYKTLVSAASALLAKKAPGS